MHLKRYRLPLAWFRRYSVFTCTRTILIAAWRYKKKTLRMHYKTRRFTWNKSGTFLDSIIWTKFKRSRETIRKWLRAVHYKLQRCQNRRRCNVVQLTCFHTLWLRTTKCVFFLPVCLFSKAWLVPKLSIYLSIWVPKDLARVRPNVINGFFY